VLILVDRTRSLFDKFQTGCVWAIALISWQSVMALKRRTYVKEVKNCHLNSSLPPC
jgi:hypothetical protein